VLSGVKRALAPLGGCAALDAALRAVQASALMRRRIIMKADAGSRRRLKLQNNNSVRGTDNGSSQAVQSQRL
jgi:hypothetical protein